MKVAVFGLGYVGTVTAAVLASNGHEVWGVDVDVAKVGVIAEGKSPVIEPELEELVRTAVSTGRLCATTDLFTALDGAELSLVCVGTPSSPTGSTDLTYVLRAVSDIVDTLAAGAASPSGRHAVVVRSTIPPGTIDGQVAPLVMDRLAGSALTVGTGMCPEFLREGSAIADSYDSPLTVVGTKDPHVGDLMRRLFSFLDCPVRVVSTRDAEGLKYACNAFHATKVSFANELGRLFRTLGVDARLVMSMFCDDTKLNLSASYLSPGFAFGGSCLPKDLRGAALSGPNELHRSANVGRNPCHQPFVHQRRRQSRLATDARSVALLGLSFKADSDDLRESPYVDLAETLIGKGFDVRIYYPASKHSPALSAPIAKYLIHKRPHVQRALRSSDRRAKRRPETWPWWFSATPRSLTPWWSTLRPD